MGNGYWQKLLRVDLTNKKASVEPLEEKDLKRFVGGAGLAAEILRRKHLTANEHNYLTTATAFIFQITIYH